RTTPSEVGLTDWEAIAAGASHTCGVRSDNSMWCFGNNNDGELGNGSNNSSTADPVQVATTANWDTVTAGTAHTCARRVDNTVWCWGANSNGQLGNGTLKEKDVPTQVGAVNSYVQVDAGGTHTCAVRSDKSLWCWGNNANGQLGDGSHSVRT